MNSTRRIIYLDQNKWIELARIQKLSEESPSGLLSKLCAAVNDGRVVVPLTTANIYETHKVNRPQRRYDLARIQTDLSRGYVFRSRRKRVEVELSNLLADIYKRPCYPLDREWFLSDIFFESTLEWNEPQWEGRISPSFVAHIRGAPAERLFEYLTRTPEFIRTIAVQNFSSGSEELRHRIETRRQAHATETQDMRRRIQNALLMINDLDLILSVGARLQLGWATVADIGETIAHKIMLDTPTYNVERELAIRLEGQSRPLHNNDIRDMESFCTVIPYANVVIGENQFVNLARQAGLGKKYDTDLHTDLTAVAQYLD